MARRPTTKASRGGRASVVSAPITSPRATTSNPTPHGSAYPTPLSSAYPSAYASEAEFDANDEVNKIPIGSLSLQDGDASGEISTTRSRHVPSRPFRFLDLPSELRIKIYQYYFADTPDVIDLEPDNYKRIHKKLALLRTCRTIYSEATHVFYSSHTFRVFPTCPGRFFKTKKPLLARLNQRQRSCITSLELRLGPGWNKPPRGWVVNPALGLSECVNVRSLTVFVECDPSDSVFNGFRRADGFYEGFSQILLAEILQEMPFLDRVYFDAWTSVKRSGKMILGLLDTTRDNGKAIGWGPERGWTDDDEEVACDSSHAAKATAMLNGVGMNVVIVA